MPGGAKALGIVLACQALMSFVNPWTWRLAVLPFQTLVFLRHNQIAGGQAGPHPWSQIGEFFSPFSEFFAATPATSAYCVLLYAVVPIGLLACLLLRRWSWALAIAGIAVVSMNMRRNIAPGAMLIVPPAVAAIYGCMAWLGRRRPALLRPLTPGSAIMYPSLAVACAALGIYLTISVITHEFYFRFSSPLRFGAGYAFEVPLGACQWLNANKPAGRIWTDYNSSSNVHYLTRPHMDVPIVTNTWAFPPSIMGTVLDVAHGRQPFDAGRLGAQEPVAARYDIQIILLETGATTAKLVRHLIDSPQWSLVYIDAMHVVFLRNDGPNAQLAARARLTPQTFDVGRFIERLRRLDPRVPQAMLLGGMTLGNLGWTDQALDVLRATVRRRPTYADGWNLLGVGLAQRAQMLMSQGHIDQAHKGFLDAEEAFEAALECRPSLKDAQTNLNSVHKDLSRWR